MTVLIFIIILGFLILAHELGHFITARKNGIRVDEFGLGLPPRMVGLVRENGTWAVVWGKNKPKETQGCIYSINWLPLGGFVKIKGEDGGFADEPDSFTAKAIWKRIVVLISGVSMNVIVAMVLLSFVFMIGVPTVVSSEQIAQGKIRSSSIAIIDILPESPAAQAGIKRGESIVSVDGVSVSTVDALRSYLGSRENQSVTLTVQSDKNVQRMIVVKPEILNDQQHVGIGVSLIQTGIISYSIPRALLEGVKETFYLIGEILKSLGRVLATLWSQEPLSLDVSGPVGIAVMTGEVVKLGFVYILQFAALLSINLAIINILPFPALDGGRVLFLLIEKIRGRPVDKRIEGVVHNTGFALLIALIVLVTFRDIVKLF